MKSQIAACAIIAGLPWHSCDTCLPASAGFAIPSDGVWHLYMANGLDLRVAQAAVVAAASADPATVRWGRANGTAAGCSFRPGPDRPDSRFVCIGTRLASNGGGRARVLKAWKASTEMPCAPRSPTHSRRRLTFPMASIWCPVAARSLPVGAITVR